MSDAYGEAWEAFLEECGEDTPEFEVEFASAWNSCKDEVIKILEQDIQNADLSWESCDKRFIEKIKEL